MCRHPQGMSVYTNRQLVTAWQHPICFQRSMFFDHATAGNSKCQALRAPHRMAINRRPETSSNILKAPLTLYGRDPNHPETLN